MINHDDAVMELTALQAAMTFAVHRTRGGSLAVVFNDAGKGDKPKLGAYYTGTEWIVCQWDVAGMFLGEPRKLDLIIVSDQKELA